MQALIEAWHISHRMNEFLLKGIKEQHFSDRTILRGKTVGDLLVHIHNVRLIWIKAGMPILFLTQKKIERDSISKETLKMEWAKSSAAIVQLLEAGFITGKIKGFKSHPEAFLAYLIAHEAYHRGQIILTLKQNGHLPGKKVLDLLWLWTTK